MKNKVWIVPIIIIVIGLLIFGYSYMSKNYNNIRNESMVELYYRDSSYRFPNYEKIELTPEQKEKIVKFYKNTDTKTKQEIKLGFLGSIQLKFYDGNIIIMDEDEDVFARYNDEYIIKISSKFKNYILDIID